MAQSAKEEGALRPGEIVCEFHRASLRREAKGKERCGMCASRYVIWDGDRTEGPSEIRYAVTNVNFTGQA